MSPASMNELCAFMAAICALSLLLSAIIASYVCCDTQADSSNAARGAVAAATVRFLFIDVFLVITVDLHWRLTQVAPDRRVSWPFGCRIRPQSRAKPISSTDGKSPRTAANIPEINQNPRLSCGSALLRLATVMPDGDPMIVRY